MSPGAGAGRGLQDFTEESDCKVPGRWSKLKAVLDVSKFAAPTSGDQIDRGDLGRYCSKYLTMKARFLVLFLVYTDNVGQYCTIPGKTNLLSTGFASLPCRLFVYN